MTTKIVKPEEMVSVKCEMESQELCINSYRDEDKMHISVTDNIMLTKIKRSAMKSPDLFHIEAQINEKGEVEVYNITAPKKLLSIRGVLSTRTLTEEQRRAASERMHKLRKENSK